MKLDETIAMLKSRKRPLIQEKKNPTFNLIVMAYKVNKEFLNRIRKKEELEDIKCKYPSGFEIKLNRALPFNSVIYMQDEVPMVAWIGGRLKLMTRKKEVKKNE